VIGVQGSRLRAYGMVFPLRKWNGISQGQGSGPMMGNNLKEGLRWLDQAEADLRTSKNCLSTGDYYASAFFSQQAAEKALKGFLYSKGFRALVTHSVTELLEESAKQEKNFEGMTDYGKELDRHYIGSRYPNFYPSGAPYRYYTKEMAERCISYAESILQEVRRYLRR
jgi:HEPN domain-containing protein